MSELLKKQIAGNKSTEKLQHVHKASYKLSTLFSAFIVKHLEDEKRNNKSLSEKPTVAEILGLELTAIEQIKDSKRVLTVEEAIQLEKAYEVSISSLLKKELAGKQIPEKLQDVHKAFLKFSENKTYLVIQTTEETAKQLSILEQEEKLVERIKELKETAELLKIENKVLEERKIADQNQQSTKFEIELLNPTEREKVTHQDELVEH